MAKITGAMLLESEIRNLEDTIRRMSIRESRYKAQIAGLERALADLHAEHAQFADAQRHTQDQRS